MKIHRITYPISDMILWRSILKFASANIAWFNAFRRLIAMNKVTEVSLESGITMNDGIEWKELRNWTMRNLRNVGFAKRKMEELLLDELVLVIDKLKQHDVYRIKMAIETAVINVLWKLLTGQQIIANAKYVLHNRKIIKSISSRWFIEL